MTLEYLMVTTPRAMTEPYLHIHIGTQRLQLRCDGAVLRDYAISTARNGAGETNGSNCTPRGWHRIRIRIGAGCASDTVFVGRRPTGETYAPELRAQFPERDWILTRILWLTGLEPGRNRGGKVDTLRRYVYIHGSPDDVPMGQPGSHGCIRMRNADVIELFDQVTAGMRVLIEE